MASEPVSENISNSISETQPPTVDEVPFELVAQHERKTTNLLRNSNSQNSLKSQNKFFDFNFESPLFIELIFIFTTDFVDGSKFDYYWIGVDGVKHEGDQVSKGDRVRIEIHGVAKSVSFKPPRAYFTKPYIKNVQIYGFELAKAGEFIRYADQVSLLKIEALNTISKELAVLENAKAEVNALQAQRGTLQQDISSMKSSISREQGKLKTIELQKNNLIIQTGEMERSISDQKSRSEGMQYEVSRLSKIRSELSDNIIGKKRKLNELETNIDLFPSELSSFSKQGARDFKYFSIISAIPISIIVTMFVLLITGAADLTTKITGSESINLAALAVSRSPYVVIACTIITASYYIAKMLILEMVRISRQRLSLTKISIIAKDISASLEDGLDITDEQKYNRRLSLKMDLMRDHLKEYISKDFQPTLPENISPSMSLLANSVKKQTEA